MKGRAGKRHLKLHMVRSKSGRFNKRSHAEKYVKPNYWATFNWFRAGMLLGLLVLIGYLIGKVL